MSEPESPTEAQHASADGDEPTELLVKKPAIAVDLDDNPNRAYVAPHEVPVAALPERVSDGPRVIFNVPDGGATASEAAVREARSRRRAPTLKIVRGALGATATSDLDQLSGPDSVDPRSDAASRSAANASTPESRAPSSNEATSSKREPHSEAEIGVDLDDPVETPKSSSRLGLVAAVLVGVGIVGAGAYLSSATDVPPPQGRVAAVTEAQALPRSDSVPSARPTGSPTSEARIAADPVAPQASAASPSTAAPTVASTNEPKAPTDAALATPPAAATNTTAASPKPAGDDPYDSPASVTPTSAAAAKPTSVPTKPASPAEPATTAAAPKPPVPKPPAAKNPPAASPAAPSDIPTEI
jgi:hypothetical protein